jgi:hypothetical protein
MSPRSIEPRVSAVNAWRAMLVLILAEAFFLAGMCAFFLFVMPWNLPLWPALIAAIAVNVVAWIGACRDWNYPP